jgi:xanthine dehydrogenase accessory factor
MNEKVILVRGAGDMATGAIHKLHRAGFKVVATEIEKPLAVRRPVCLSEVIYEGYMKVEDMEGVLVKDLEGIHNAWANNQVPVIIDKDLKILEYLKPDIIVDAILAKKNLGTKREMCDKIIALGPGFIAGDDVDIVIETNRGHDLARIYFQGSTSADTGIPGDICGLTSERVFYAPCDGIIKNNFKICDYVEKGDVIATVNDMPIIAEISGFLRGLIRDKYYVKSGLKLGDIEPRIDTDCYTITDKARAIGGSVLEAALILLNRN